MVDVQLHTTTRLVVDLRDVEAGDVERAGAKAAKLAQAVAAGWPVLPGFVLVASSAVGLTTDELVELRAAWEALTDTGELPLVVRSSSPHEDGDTSSMAGRFESVLDVRGWQPFLEAIDRVRRSANGGPMAVLAQPLLVPVAGGVLFGADPVTGDPTHTVVAAVAGGPHRLVAGEVEGTYHVLNRLGRLVEVRDGSGGARLTPEQRHALHHLGRRLARQFGGPQDVEWAWDATRGLVLLQTRPITTATAPSAPTGPLFGPGPIAETFPEPLTALEEALWLTPLAAGLREALAITGTASRRNLRRSPVVRTVDGRAVVDLGLLGLAPPKHPWLHRFDPRPPARRLVAAWRVGRLRAALPSLAEDILAGVDQRLAAVPSLDTLDDGELLDLLDRVATALVAVHGHEVLMGLVIGGIDGAGSAIAVALRALATGRAAGHTDEEIAAVSPVVLGLVPPSIVRPLELPPTPNVIPPAATTDRIVELREALRLRARWLQELSARAALELGRRHSVGTTVALLHHDELRQLVMRHQLPADIAGRHRPTSPPLPTMFRLAEDGTVVAVTAPGSSTGRGIGAGGERRSGTVFHLVDAQSNPPPGSVLVVQSLEPRLIAWLPDAAAVVSETGSPLSHLAILAREMGVPVVVGVGGARESLAEGSVVVVDGRTGEVEPV
jgi:pyruvate,water dikinase